MLTGVPPLIAQGILTNKTRYAHANKTKQKKAESNTTLAFLLSAVLGPLCSRVHSTQLTLQIELTPELCSGWGCCGHRAEHADLYLWQHVDYWWTSCHSKQGQQRQRGGPLESRTVIMTCLFSMFIQRDSSLSCLIVCLCVTLLSIYPTTGSIRFCAVVNFVK